MADMIVGRVIPAVNSGNYSLTEKVLDKQKIVMSKEVIIRLPDGMTIDDGNEGPRELIRCKDCELRFTAACSAPSQAMWDERFFCRDGRRKGSDQDE